MTYGLVMIAISVGFAGPVDLRGDPRRSGSAGRPSRRRCGARSPGSPAACSSTWPATLVAAFGAPLAALIIFGLLAVYYLFEHLPSPAAAAPSG